MSRYRYFATARVCVAATFLAVTFGMAVADPLGPHVLDPGMPARLHHPHLVQFAPATPKLLVEGMGELQGSAVGPDGALYVTAPLSGEIWRVEPGTGDTTLFAGGLPARDPDPFHVGSGVVDVVFREDTAYALVTSVDVEYGAEDYAKGIYRIDGPDSHTVIANIGTWSEANLPTAEYFIDSGFQYAIENYGDGFVVTDAHHNRVLSVSLEGDITELLVLDNVVPTGLSVSGQSIYVTLAGPIPHEPENGKLVVLDEGALAATEVAAGARLLVDVEYVDGNSLFVLSQGTWQGEFDGEPALPDTGSLVRADGNGGFQVLAAPLDRPTSLEIIGGSAYVTSLGGEVWTVEDVVGPTVGQR